MHAMLLFKAAVPLPLSLSLSPCCLSHLASVSVSLALPRSLSLARSLSRAEMLRMPARLLFGARDKSMSLKYEPASEPLHVSVKYLFN